MDGCFLVGCFMGVFLDGLVCGSVFLVGCGAVFLVGLGCGSLFLVGCGSIFWVDCGSCVGISDSPWLWDGGCDGLGKISSTSSTINTPKYSSQCSVSILYTGTSIATGFTCDSSSFICSLPFSLQFLQSLFFHLHMFLP